jgi:hypothetical protein
MSWEGQQASYEASPLSYAAQGWDAQNQQSWNEQPYWNAPQQADWNTPQAPSWNQQQGQQWTGNAQQPDQQQWYTQVNQPEQASPTAQAGQPNQQMGLVPYQGGMELQVAGSRTSMLHLIPADLAEKMLPAIPQEEMAVYVPPMYTKPRAIIPRYRAVSGLLSVIIVTILLCVGAGYVAKANGTLDTLTRVVTGQTHIKPLPAQTSGTLSMPTTLRTNGPAYGVIYSATTTSRVDATTGLPIQEEHSFKINQTIHVTYAVQSTKPGTVQIQWFSNNNPLTAPITAAFDPKDGQNKHADATIRYEAVTQGSVQLKWNDQLAITLYFVVQP